MYSLKNLRIKNKLSTECAAKELEISKSMLYKIEEGVRVPSSKVIKKMSNIYDCPLESIFKALRL